MAGRDPEEGGTRRGFVIAAGTGLALAYGTFAAFMARFLLPREGPETAWSYVARLDRVPSDQALVYRTPAGAVVNIARRAPGGDDLVALSSVCPHLGCQVHWEPHNDRFFCPCHNGVFDPSGVAIAGPPAEAGQSLLEYPLKAERGLLFIGLRREELAMGRGAVLDDGRRGCCDGCADAGNCEGRRRARRS